MSTTPAPSPISVSEVRTSMINLTHLQRAAIDRAERRSLYCFFALDAPLVQRASCHSAWAASQGGLLAGISEISKFSREIWAA